MLRSLPADDHREREREGAGRVAVGVRSEGRRHDITHRTSEDQRQAAGRRDGLAGCGHGDLLSLRASQPPGAPRKGYAAPLPPH
ncbi:hypothetical protein E2C01_088742 [Portunus trituberculatus]|uniref:Uncharacterized protein n=1 Tax=Portunus trituberculatus TaxID=210409 RepID=A0A5B7JKN9_PORTR|nr:hypothetical protein [Portunus trituberculatus]